jgi:5'-nucleotidase
VREFRLEDGSQAFASDGAPSDCVSLALLGYFKEKFDLVVSGINFGANLGHDVTYSGTVTAAMEAVIAGMSRHVAVSLENPEGTMPTVDYSASTYAARVAVENVIAHGCPKTPCSTSTFRF